MAFGWVYIGLKPALRRMPSDPKVVKKLLHAVHFPPHCLFTKSTRYPCTAKNCFKNRNKVHNAAKRAVSTKEQRRKDPSQMAKSEEKKRTEREAWRSSLAERAAAEGFFEEIGPLHKAIHIPEDGELGKTLVVVFDNLDDIRQDPNRLPWAVDFISSQGWSSLGVMAHGPTWYRDAHMFAFFDRLRDEKFFDKFDRVVFYGTSMGGYAAASFSAACPGATVVAISPQATMDRDRAGWDHRYKRSWIHDYDGPYGYAPDLSAAAEKVWVFYDARMPQDAMHASLFRGSNVIDMGCPFMGHGMLTMWRDMGVLKPIISGVINDTLTPTSVRRLLRARHQSKMYQKALLQYLEGTTKHRLLIRYCFAILKTRPAPHFRNAAQRARQHLRENA